MITILCPSRNRPENVRRMATSAISTAADREKIQFCFRIDNDEPQAGAYLDFFVKNPLGLNLVYKVGERIVMSDYWNELLPFAAGDILMLGGDDVLFKTQGWDKLVEDFFASLPDKIAYAFGDDGSPNGKVFGTHGIVHQRWIDALGFFTARGYSADYADAWPNEVAKKLGRLKYLPFEVEHLHPVWGKAPFDKTYQETNARLHRDDTPGKFAKEEPLRNWDVEKLRPLLLPLPAELEGKFLS